MKETFLTTEGLCLWLMLLFFEKTKAPRFHCTIAILCSEILLVTLVLMAFSREVELEYQHLAIEGSFSFTNVFNCFNILDVKNMTH